MQWHKIHHEFQIGNLAGVLSFSLKLGGTRSALVELMLFTQVHPNLHIRTLDAGLTSILVTSHGPCFDTKIIKAVCITRQYVPLEEQQ